MPLALLTLVGLVCGYFFYMINRSRSTTVTDIGSGDDEGFVWKRGRWLGTWNKRYLIRKGHLVYCFEADEMVCSFPLNNNKILWMIVSIIYINIFLKYFSELRMYNTQTNNIFIADKEACTIISGCLWSATMEVGEGNREEWKETFYAQVHQPNS